MSVFGVDSILFKMIKNYLFSGLMFASSILAILVIIQSCTQDNSEDLDIEAKALNASIFDLPEVLNDVSFGDSPIPNGTRVEKISKKEINLVYPEGVFRIVRDYKSQAIFYLSSQTWTCTGTCSGGGCDVFYFPGEGFGCSACKNPKPNETCTGSAGGGGEERIADGDLEVLGYLDLNKGISILPSIKESIFH